MARNANGPLEAEKVCQILCQAGLISEDQQKEILEKRVSAERKLGRIRSLPPAIGTGGRGSEAFSVVDVIHALNVRRADNPDQPVDEEIIYQALARAWGFPYKKIDPLQLDLNLVTGTIPHKFARKHLVLPIAVEDGSLIVATVDPFNVEGLQDISRACHMKVKPVVSTRSDITKLIGEFFGFKRSIAAAAHQFGGESFDLGNLEQYVRVRSAEELPSDDRHIVNATNHLLSYAFDQRASDVHIEPKRDASLVRMRIDGVLHTVYKLPKNVHSAVVNRIKTLSRLDMAEKRKPQDGRIKTEKGGVEVEIRVSTVPVAFGEKVVMRLMDPQVLFQDFDELGFTPQDLEHYRYMIGMPHGIVLVCGPTGSGKSTTLYSTLQYVSTPEVNITTIEDPIEMIHPEFNQIAVRPVVGITFGSILRNVLRQDPDIIMVGKMRDLETAQNAIQAALTGHLVLSTLHTNDAPSSVTRLLDLGIPSYLIQSTLNGVVGQRLVRKICTYCKESFQMEGKELRSMGLVVGQKGPVTLHRGKGCIRCRGTGFLGRTGVFEVLPITDALKHLITPETDLQALRSQARKDGITTLRENALRKLLEGQTTVEEVLRVTWEKT